MAKTWRGALREEALAFGKTGLGIGKEIAETCISELGSASGHKGAKFNFPTKIAWVEWAEFRRKGR